MTDFENLYQRYARDVYRFALYLCGNTAEAEDIASETFVRVWTIRDTLRAASVKAYLFTIARNLHNDAYRAVQNVTLRGIVETFDSVTLVEGCERGKRAETAVPGVGPQAVPGFRPGSQGADSE